jgi:RNA polymerase-interacting CarD/CdnL/TRCF family regulator
METQTPVTVAPSIETPETKTPQVNTSSANEFSIGSHVVYSLHGKCVVVAIENRSIGAENIRFYKLERLKPALSRSTRTEPAIWLPTSSAKERGLRAPMSPGEAQKCLETLTSREYYFSINESWTTIHPKLEATIRIDGAIGLAKVASYLYVLKKKQVVPATEVTRFQESVNKLLFRELSETTGQSIKTLEDQIAKGLRHKLIPDT